MWRNLVAVVCSTLLGAIVGGIVSVAMGAVGASPGEITLVTALLGFILGLAISIVPMKLILGKDYGEFRLVLVARAGDAP